MCQQKKRILVRLGNTSIPKVFDDWSDLLDYIKQENLAGRVVAIRWWEYV